MSKRAELPQSRHHVLIFDEDWAFLEANYGIHSANRIGAGVAIRKLVHSHVRQLKQKVQDIADARTQGQYQHAFKVMNELEGEMADKREEEGFV